MARQLHIIIEPLRISDPKSSNCPYLWPAGNRCSGAAPELELARQSFHIVYLTVECADFLF